jgi:hypothetical protein
MVEMMAMALKAAARMEVMVTREMAVVAVGTVVEKEGVGEGSEGMMAVATAVAKVVA